MGKISKQLQVLSQLAAEHQPALASETSSLSYQEMEERVSELANCLVSLNAQVVALHIENSVDWVVIDLACQEAQIICVPLPAFFSSEQIMHCLKQVNVDLLISDKSTTGKLAAKAVQLPQLSIFPPSLFVWQWQNKPPGYLHDQLPKGTQKVTFTSGSTGTPKGVCLSIDHQWQVAQSLADAIGINKPKHLCLLPLSTLLENIAGIYAPLLRGGTVIVARDNDRGLSGSSGLNTSVLLSFIDRTQPDSLILLPQLLLVLVAACQQGWKPPCSLKFVAVGGARVAPSLIAQARRYQIPVFQGYGLSECGSVVALNTLSHDKLKSVGHVLPHCRVSTKNGEILVTGTCHLGYLGDKKSWYPSQIKTGDLGSLNEGFLSIGGRQKNTLITSYGRNISPEWVESELMATPLLSHCMVIGDSQPFISALISAPDAVSKGDLMQWVQQVNKKLPDYAQVKQWLRLEPQCWRPLMTANGRLQREAVCKAFKKEIENIYDDHGLTLSSGLTSLSGNINTSSEENYEFL